MDWERGIVQKGQPSGQAKSPLESSGCPCDFISSQMACFAQQRRNAELDLVGSVLADHVQLIPIAAVAGIRSIHFASEDLQTIYAAAISGRHSDRRQVLLVAMNALDRLGYWDETQVASNFGQCLWNCESLVLLANSHFPSESLVRCYVARVIRFHERECAIRQSCEDLVELLNSDIGSLSVAGRAAA